MISPMNTWIGRPVRSRPTSSGNSRDAHRGRNHRTVCAAAPPIKAAIGGVVHYIAGLSQYVMFLTIVAATVVLSLLVIHRMIVVIAIVFSVPPAALGLTSSTKSHSLSLRGITR